MTAALRQGRLLPSPRQPWGRFAARAVPAALLAAWLGIWLTDRFSLAVDAQVERSLPVRLLLIDRHRTDIVRGRKYAFAASGLQPWIRDGQIIVKIADGLPGDRVEVTEHDVTVNGVAVVNGLALAGTLGQPVQRYIRTEVVPAGRIFMLGRAPNSFDSRYWGAVEQSRIVGTAYALF